MKFDMEKSVTRKEALGLMRENWRPAPQTETVALERSLNRVSARALYSRNTLPVKRASCFDGIAVRRADFSLGLPDTSNWIKGRDFVRADTGDDFPDAFDTVIAVEDVILEGDGVRFAEGFEFDPEDETVDPAGTIVMQGALLVPGHTRITPELIAALAMGGVTWVPVLREPRIAFIPTGSELIVPGIVPGRGENVESNGLMLRAMLGQWGAKVLPHPIIRDDSAQLEQALDEALACSDMVLINGGSSRGEEDLCSYLVQRRSSFFRHGVKAVPGRPVGFAIIVDKPVINVPGPVAATYLAAHWCLSALICHWYGLPAVEYHKVTATLDAPVKKRAGFELIGRVSLQRTASGFIATPLAWGDDGIPGLLLHTDGLINVPIETTHWDAGDSVEVELVKSPELIRSV